VADTGVLKHRVEPFVTERLEAGFGQPFSQQCLPIGRRADGSVAMHEFDAVSADWRTVASIENSSGNTSGGRLPSGNTASAYKELDFLCLADADRQINGSSQSKVLRKGLESCGSLAFWSIRRKPLCSRSVSVPCLPRQNSRKPGDGWNHSISSRSKAQRAT
jgi:hypothetical protein